MATCTPQRQPREALQASAEKCSPAASSSGDEAVMLLPRGIEDLPEALRSKFSEKARWIAQAGGPRPAAAASGADAGAGARVAPAAAPPVPPTTTPGGRGAAAPTAPAEAAPPAAQAPRARTGLLLRRRQPRPAPAGGEPAAAAAAEPKRKAARTSAPEPPRGPPALPTCERPSARAVATAAAKERAGTAELEKAKKAAEKASAASVELRRERDRLLKENTGLKRKLQALEAASNRRAVAASSKTASAASVRRRPAVLSLKSAPKEVKVRIKALKTEAKHLRKYGVSITLQQPQGMATWTAAVKGARKELGVTGFKQARKGTKLYRKAKEINERLLRKRKAEAKRAARA